ncbi:MAG: hypothetical protein R3F11_06930 [Verrucomicrobiales bacterium]
MIRALLTLAAALALGAAPISAAPFEVVADAGDGLKNPFGVAFDEGGNLYIAEYEGGRLWKMAPGGKPAVVSGDGSKGYSRDGTAAADAKYNGMHNVCAAPDGTLYLSDTRNNLVRKIGADGKVRTVAGVPGKKGFAGDGGPATEALLNDPISIALSADAKTLYIADINNRRIRAVDLASGAIETAAGNGEKGAPEDGATAKDAPLTDPRACDVDSEGNLYILERGGHALRVVRPGGKIYTVAGTGKAGAADGSRQRSQMNGPKHLCLDDQDRVIVADAENHLIRRYDPKTRRLETILGKEEKLNRPHGVWVHGGWLYVCDSWNDRVLRMKAD